MTEPRPRIERQAVAIVKLYLRRQLKEAAHGAGICRCPACSRAPKRIREWIDQEPERT